MSGSANAPPPPPPGSPCPIAKKWTHSVPIGEVVGELDDLGDGFRVPLGDAAHVQLAVAFLLHLSNHPLESGAPPNGKEDLGGDPIGDAL